MTFELCFKTSQQGLEEGVGVEGTSWDHIDNGYGSFIVLVSLLLKTRALFKEFWLWKDSNRKI